MICPSCKRFVKLDKIVMNDQFQIVDIYVFCNYCGKQNVINNIKNVNIVKRKIKQLLERKEI